MAAFTPFNPAIGPFTKFCLNEPAVLQLKEKVLSLSGDDFVIKTVAGLDVCKCEGKTFSMSGRKTFTDMQGNHLFDLRKQHFKIPSSFHAEDSSGRDILVVKGEWSLMSSKSHATFVNGSDGASCELNIKGDWLDRKASITMGDRPVAHISRSFGNARELLGGQQTYFVEVAPGVDLSLIAALCICLDERENEKH